MDSKPRSTPVTATISVARFIYLVRVVERRSITAEPNEQIEQIEQNVNFGYVNYTTDRWNMEHEHAFETDDGICSFITMVNTYRHGPV